MARKIPVEAYVLISVNKDIPSVIRSITEIDINKQITEMSLVFGGADIITKIKIESLQELYNFVLCIIEKIDRVASARTFIINKSEK